MLRIQPNPLGSTWNLESKYETLTSCSRNEGEAYKEDEKALTNLSRAKRHSTAETMKRQMKREFELKIYTQWKPIDDNSVEWRKANSH